MTQKETVQHYMDGSRKSDHQQILSCLTEDVVWNIPGHTVLEGLGAFDAEIENDAFEGQPVIQVSRMVEEHNIVVAEGRVQSKMKNGNLLDAVFCDVFEFEHEKIKKLTSYLMPLQK